MKNLQVENRLIARSTLALLVMGIATVGCGGTEADDTESEVGAVTLLAAPAYVNHAFTTLIDSNGVRLTSDVWIKCASNQVLVGFHKNQLKGLCATASNRPLTVAATHIDAPDSSATQITAGATTMHGCPAGSFIQGIAAVGNNEWLYCVTFNEVPYSTVVALDTATQSNTVYNISNPQSHVCPATRILSNGVFRGYEAQAMVGIHQSKNHFACVR